MADNDKQNYLVCPLCHKLTPEGNEYCRYCWARLAPEQKVSAAESREYLEKAAAVAKRKKRIRRIAITIGSVIIAVVVILGGLYKYTDVLNKSFPTLNSDSPAGQWSMFRHDLSLSGVANSTRHFTSGPSAVDFSGRRGNRIVPGNSGWRCLFWL